MNKKNKFYIITYVIVSLGIIIWLLFLYLLKRTTKQDELVNCNHLYGLDSTYFGSHSSVIECVKDVEGEREYKRLPLNGCIQNHIMAIRLACIYWEIDYEQQLQEEKPFNTTLIGDSLWIVEGTLPKDQDGGTVYIEMLKKNGEVINYTHFK